MSMLKNALLNGTKDDDVMPAEPCLESEESNVPVESSRVVDEVDMVFEATVGYTGIPLKDAKAIQEDFRMCKHEVAHCDAMLESLSSAPGESKSEKLFKQRQITAISKKRSHKNEHLRRLNARLKALHEHHRTGCVNERKTATPLLSPRHILSPKHEASSYPTIMTPGSSQVVHDSSTGIPSTSLHKQAMLISAPLKIEDIAHHEEAPHEQKPASFHVDRSRIHALDTGQQESELQQLGLTVYNQDDFEQGVLEQADEAYANAEMIQNKAMEKEMQAIQDDVTSCQSEITTCDKALIEMSHSNDMSKDTRRRMEAIKRQRENKVQNLKRLKGRQKALYTRMIKSLGGMDGTRSTPTHPATNQIAANVGVPGHATNRAETEQERMIRMGEMTPFGTVIKSQDDDATQMSSFERYLRDQSARAQKPVTSSHKSKTRRRESVSSAASARSIKQEPITAPSAPIRRDTENFFDVNDKKSYRPTERDFSNYSPRKRKLHADLQHNFTGDGAGSDIEVGDEIDEDDYAAQFQDQDYVPPHAREFESGSEGEIDQPPRKKQKRDRTQTRDDVVDIDLGALKSRYGVKKRVTIGGSSHRVARTRDDGSREAYEQRIREWRRERVLEKQAAREAGQSVESSDDDSDVEFDHGFKVPSTIWRKLYRYQRTCVKWLWELHQQQCGGIVGDEMGLGKTIQVIAFLAALKNSKIRDRASNSRYVGLGPVVIVCPITVMHQWVGEFHKWWPSFRVAVLHSSGSFTCKERELVREIVRDCGVLITSYSHTVIHQEILHKPEWHYVVLDEGHKIRNPDAQATIAVKQFRTCHRLILSGSPLQNNLKELWSLFDFVFPGKLGTLPDFMAHFSVPITSGGYANATQVQVTTAYKCACILRDTINPYLLRRMKADVKVSLDLPQKNEQVLFCRLTDHQRDVYREYLESKECQQILRGNYMVFPGLITLRKVCNHPDLSTGGPEIFDQHHLDEGLDSTSREYGHFSRSGKLIVVESLLKIWHRQKHRVLLFTQGTQMMNILEQFVRSRNYSYMRMDGQTSIGSRQPLINKFNEDKSIFVFLLTTRVGGLGVNLTGADRVVIFDPDWNPSTDLQARERAWRIGQDKQVTIYRLITTGTIEEKIYHRQIFKQFLTNRVLKDPKQRRFFKSNDMYELFTLGDDDLHVGTETSAIFAGTGSDVTVIPRDTTKEKKNKRKNRFDVKKEKEQGRGETYEDPDLDMSGSGELDWDNDKLNHMKEMAKRLSQQFKADTSSPVPAQKSSKTDQSQTRTSIEATKSKHETKSRNNEDNGNSNDSVTCGTTTDACDNDIEMGEIITGQSDQSHDCTTKDAANEISSQLGSNNSDEVLQKRSELSNAASLKDSVNKEKTKNGSIKEKSQGHAGRDFGDKGKEKKKKRRRKEEEKRKEKDRKRDKDKKKKRKRDAKFEGERVANLAGQSVYKPPDELDEKPSNDDVVLQALFSKTGVHSAMQHDTIMQASHPDYALVEGEAERVAREAARALRASRAACYSATSGRPTWTGHSGVTKPRFGQKKNKSLVPLKVQQEEKKQEKQKTKSSVPKELPLFAPDPVSNRHFDGTMAGNVKQSTSSQQAQPSLMSSADLLSRMRTRNFAAPAIAEVDPDNTEELSVAVAEADPVYMDLITDIRNFVAFQAKIDGQAETQEILDEFGPRLPPQDSAKFKAMLKQLCDLHKENGVGIWRLKIDFR